MQVFLLFLYFYSRYYSSFGNLRLSIGWTAIGAVLLFRVVTFKDVGTVTGIGGTPLCRLLPLF